MADILKFERIQRVRKGESRLVYIAAPFTAREQALELKGMLEAAGHVVTSSWITSHLSDMDDLRDEEKAAEGNHDAEGVARCEILVFLNDAGPSTSGGMHVEFGLALAWRKKILIVGEKTSIFHYLPNLQTTKSIRTVNDAIYRFFPRANDAPQAAPALEIQ